MHSITVVRNVVVRFHENIERRPKTLSESEKTIKAKKKENINLLANNEMVRML